MKFEGWGLKPLAAPLVSVSAYLLQGDIPTQLSPLCGDKEVWDNTKWLS